MDRFLGDGSVELVGTYAFFERGDYEAYAGVGLRFGVVEGVPILLGVRAYPFARKRVGLHLETAGLLLSESDGVSEMLLRGSLGVHVRFGEDAGGE